MQVVTDFNLRPHTSFKLKGLQRISRSPFFWKLHVDRQRERAYSCIYNYKLQ